MSSKQFLVVVSSILSLFVILGLLAFVPLPTPFSYYNPLGHGPWPEGTITYYNDSGYDKSLDVAFEQWEATGLPNKFVETEDQDSADIVFKDDEAGLEEACDTDGCLAHTSYIGYSPVRQTTIHLVPARQDDLEKIIQNPNYVPTIIHEIGHVLGLRHNDNSCSIMNSNALCRSFATVRVNNSGTAYLCGPFETDKEVLDKMYNLQSSRPDDFCYDSIADNSYYNRLRKNLLAEIKSRRAYSMISTLNKNSLKKQ